MSTSSRPRRARRILTRRSPQLFTLAAGLLIAGVSAVWVTAVATVCVSTGEVEGP
jgi:hypothetical protein